MAASTTTFSTTITSTSTTTVTVTTTTTIASTSITPSTSLALSTSLAPNNESTLGNPASNVTYTAGNSTSPARNSTCIDCNPISVRGTIGISIGSTIIGILLAACGLLVLMRYRSRWSSGTQHAQHGRVSTNAYNAMKENPNEPYPTTGTTMSIESYLPVRADDSAIKNSLQALNALIEQHVENHYHHEVRPHIPHSLESTLAACGYGGDFSISTQEFMTILLDPKSRLAGIHQIIALVIIEHVHWRSAPETSLLPGQITSFINTLPPIQKQSGCAEAFDQVFTRWRHLSAFLIEPVRTNRDAPKVDSSTLAGAISRDVALINSALQPFLKPGEVAQREQKANLGAIILEGAKIGLLLFSQPTIWRFGWSSAERKNTNHGDKNAKKETYGTASGSAGSRLLVVFPSLEDLGSNGRSRRRKILEVTTVLI
ncbi:hypothetical protein BP6252_10918 [Coleophoma cylindrospora]|uniref:Uncharacterized protein n=1 Tax=Coleophoma cylindrospora TaxID=1849047 RepID=A0A3D8QNH2_9HELO|nr:hypothetical protein BP6252_10918 [Coleophoma cylindrospora]